MSRRLGHCTVRSKLKKFDHFQGDLSKVRSHVPWGKGLGQGVPAQWGAVVIYLEAGRRCPCMVRSYVTWVMVTGDPLPPVDTQTDTTENITLPQFCWWAVKTIASHHKNFTIVTAHQQSYRKVIFSVMSVCPSVHRGSHVTITHDALDLIVQDPILAPASPAHQTWGPLSPASGHQTWDPRPPLVTSGGHHWRPVQTCSLEY